MRLKADVPEVGDDQFKWLIIESDELDTKGFFIYYHVSEDFAFDTWFPSLDDAFNAAKVYGINKEDWREL